MLNCVYCNEPFSEIVCKYTELLQSDNKTHLGYLCGTCVNKWNKYSAEPLRVFTDKIRKAFEEFKQKEESIEKV